MGLGCGITTAGHRGCQGALGRELLVFKLLANGALRKKHVVLGLILGAAALWQLDLEKK